MLFERDQRPRALYFLTSGMGSVVFESIEGAGVELTTKGSEGLIGWAFLMGPARTPYYCNVQVGGSGYRVPLGAIQREFDTCVEFRQRVLEYVQHQYGIASQVSACNRLHRAEARFVRWLLMVSDRLGTSDLAMTQEFMSLMLGTRRTTVAEVCANLSRAGTIEGRRGGLRITNREALETHVCECYPILRKRFEALYSQPLAPSPRPA